MQEPVIEREQVLTTRLMSQGYQRTKLVHVSTLKYSMENTTVNPYDVVVSSIVSDVFAHDKP